MIQQINESEKNRIRNLHRKHFILNEQVGVLVKNRCKIKVPPFGLSLRWMQAMVCSSAGGLESGLES